MIRKTAIIAGSTALFVLSAGIAYAFTSGTLNVSKFNGYAVLAPAARSAVVSKATFYAVVTTADDPSASSTAPSGADFSQ